MVERKPKTSPNHPSGYPVDRPIKLRDSLEQVLDDLEEAPVVPEIVKEYRDNPVDSNDPPERPDPDLAQLEAEADSLERELNPGIADSTDSSSSQQAV